MINFINLKIESNKNDTVDSDFLNEKIIVDNSDYYFSNVIARASKTMTDCHNEKIKLKNTGTDG
jgi:NADH-quinone oxidoreductase subunit G